MAAANPIFTKSTRRIFALALFIFALDQFSKWLVLNLLESGDEQIVINGFFRLVNWGNTGAAWSLFRRQQHRACAHRARRARRVVLLTPSF